MAKAAHHESKGSTKTVRHERTGRVVTVRGLGALRGKLFLEKDVDLTKPIASQVLRGGKSSGGRKP
jgi:hypothetical protein